MERLFTLIGLAIVVFASTNIDDVFVLGAFFFAPIRCRSKIFDVDRCPFPAESVLGCIRLPKLN